MSFPTVGVLALQGGFHEHLSLLHKAFAHLKVSQPAKWQQQTPSFIEVRNPAELSRCDSLIIPGGESTTIAFIAAQSGLLEPLRQFVKVDRKPTWGTCAGLILLSEEANATKKGGQELIGGLSVRVQRNHFGRQVESFIADVDLPFLAQDGGPAPFPGVFIRAPIVEQILSSNPSEVPGGSQTTSSDSADRVQVLAVLPDRTKRVRNLKDVGDAADTENKANDIVAVRQRNVVGTSFHPELTDDIRMHVWWLEEVIKVCGPASPQ
ncbi:pyridoxine [Coniochaeta ligniaria NRRL 30616]|uniref:glutaminase n=1 Tax=Coniochaeta ligniaria NRRL 30616 TaxID=1408157 RepID=A0A1J7JJE9_9PEZI|nr:pyridoxine [Coniochaeta ligniaria NRRL 30616]